MKKINVDKLINNIKEDKEDIKKKKSTYICPSRTSCFDEIFIPPINEDDDEFVRKVKKILAKERKPLRTLMSKFASQMQMNNFKRSLLIHKTMSLSKFSVWMEILGYEWKLKVRKKEDN